MIYFLDRYHLDQYVHLMKKVEMARLWLRFRKEKRDQTPKWRD